jgi:hypothetical protein
MFVNTTWSLILVWYTHKEAAESDDAGAEGDEAEDQNRPVDKIVRKKKDLPEPIRDLLGDLCDYGVSLCRLG